MNSTIIGVNGKNTKTLDEEGVLALLRGTRPLFITLRLDRRSWVAMGQSKQRGKDAANQKLRAANGSKLLRVDSDLNVHKRRLKVVGVKFDTGPLGVIFN